MSRKFFVLVCSLSFLFTQLAPSTTYADNECSKICALLSLATVVGITTFVLVTKADPTSRAQVTALRAMNKANKPFLKHMGPAFEIDDLSKLTKEESLRAKTLLDFLQEDAIQRKLHSIPGIESVRVVKDPRDEKATSYFVGEKLFTTIYISSAGDPESWRAALERFNTEASKKAAEPH
jgi:hypothetical protein